jgi:hypothetical protein
MLCNGRKVIVVNLQCPNVMSASLSFSEYHNALALLPDGMIAVTASNRVIYLLTVTADSVSVTSRITTNEQYDQVAGLSDGNLVVSEVVSYRYHRYHAWTHVKYGRVDVLTRSGHFVRSIVDDEKLKQINDPFNIYVVGQFLFVLNDCKVFKVKITTRQLVSTLSLRDSYWPRQMYVD